MWVSPMVQVPPSTKDSVHVVEALDEHFRRFIQDLSTSEPDPGVQPYGITLSELQARTLSGSSLTAKVLTVSALFPGSVIWADEQKAIRDFDSRMDQVVGGATWCCRCDILHVLCCQALCRKT
jgi:hypothetical protein